MRDVARAEADRLRRPARRARLRGFENVKFCKKVRREMPHSLHQYEGGDRKQFRSLCAWRSAARNDQ